MKRQILSVIFSVIMFTAMSVSATAFAEPGKYDITEKMNRFCEMTAEEQAELIAKHNKSEDKVAKMNEYCALDEEGRKAFIKEHKDEYKKHHGDKKMKDHSEKMKFKGTGSQLQVLKDEFDAIKIQLTDSKLTPEQKQELRKQFIQKVKEIQLSWITPQN